MAEQPLIPPRGKVNLADYDPNYRGQWEREAARERVVALREELSVLQNKLYADGRHAVLIVLQAMDAGGKDGTIRSIFTGVSPQGVEVTSFKVPTEEERSHDFLWRIHKRVPRKGMIGVFNRSHYEDVLVVRVNGLVAESVWRKRYDQINEFEELLAESGTTILKFFLHISKDEQKKRFEERLADPGKHWKFSLGDLEVRKQWDLYMRAYEDVLEKCNRPHAPWHIVPANAKWYRDLVVMETLVKTLAGLPLRFPLAEAGIETVVIPD